MCLRGRKYGVERAAAAVRQLTELRVLDPAAAPDPARACAQLLEQMRRGQDRDQRRRRRRRPRDFDGAITRQRPRRAQRRRITRGCSCTACYGRCVTTPRRKARASSSSSTRPTSRCVIRPADVQADEVGGWAAAGASRADRGLQRAVCLRIRDGAARARGDAGTPTARQARQWRAEHAALHATVQPSALTAEFGGTLDFDREAWAIAALQVRQSQSRAAVAACGLTDL